MLTHVVWVPVYQQVPWNSRHVSRFAVVHCLSVIESKLFANSRIRTQFGVFVCMHKVTVIDCPQFLRVDVLNEEIHHFCISNYFFRDTFVCFYDILSLVDKFLRLMFLNEEPFVPANEE